MKHLRSKHRDLRRTVRSPKEHDTRSTRGHCTNIQWQNQLALGQLPALASTVKQISGLDVVAGVVSGVSADGLRELASKLAQQLGDNAAVILGVETEGRAVVMAAVAKGAQQKANAGSMVKVASEVLGGGGGGRPDFAQGGGPQAKDLTAAIDKAVSSL